MNSVISGMVSSLEMQALFINKRTINIPEENALKMDPPQPDKPVSMRDKQSVDHTISDRNAQMQNTLLRDFLLAGR